MVSADGSFMETFFLLPHSCHCGINSLGFEAAAQTSLPILYWNQDDVSERLCGVRIFILMKKTGVVLKTASNASMEELLQEKTLDF